MSREASVEVPFQVEPRPDTGLYNARLGIWLFLASDLMFFAALVSSYVLLRSGAEQWPTAADSLDLPRALLRSVLLLASAISLAHGYRSLEVGRRGRFRSWSMATALLGLLFLGLGAGEWATMLAAGQRPASSTFLAIWYTLLGVHGLHVLAGLVAGLWLLGPGAAVSEREPVRYRHRVEVVGIYWHFVVVVWLVLLIAIYLV